MVPREAIVEEVPPEVSLPNQADQSSRDLSHPIVHDQPIPDRDGHPTATPFFT